VVAVAAVVFAASVASGCSTDSIGGGIPSNSICKVYDDGIKTSDYNQILSQAQKNYKTQGQKFPKKGSDEYKRLQEQAVDYLIEQQLFRQQADKLNVDIKQKDVDKRLKQLKSSFFKGDQKAYQKELKKQGLTEKQVKDNIRQQLLSEKLFEKVTKTVKVSDAKAKKYYEDNPSQYKQPESRTVAHILVKDKAKADQIYAQVKGGDKATFAKLAKQFSQDPSSKDNGGELPVSKGQTVPEFDKVAFSLKTGEVSKPVKTQFGWHVITARTAIKPATQQKFNDVKAQIKQQLQQESRSKTMQDWRTNLRKDAEDHVDCKKGYVWTQTKSTDTSSTGAATTSTKKSKSSGKSDKGKTDTSTTSTKK
jgi:parvulin-like peptidyl-prolyl isomerase